LRRGGSGRSRCGEGASGEELGGDADGGDGRRAECQPAEGEYGALVGPAQHLLALRVGLSGEEALGGGEAVRASEAGAVVVGRLESAVRELDRAEELAVTRAGPESVGDGGPGRGAGVGGGCRAGAGCDGGGGGSDGGGHRGVLSCVPAFISWRA